MVYVLKNPSELKSRTQNRKMNSKQHEIFKRLDNKSVELFFGSSNRRRSLGEKTFQSCRVQKLHPSAFVREKQRKGEVRDYLEAA